MAQIDSNDLVPGDIVHLYPGKKVPADIRLIQIKGGELIVDESIYFSQKTITSKTCVALKTKTSDISKLKNMAFTGSYILKGDAVGVVVNTGKRIQGYQLFQNHSTSANPFQQFINKYVILLTLVEMMASIAFIITQNQELELQTMTLKDLLNILIEFYLFTYLLNQFKIYEKLSKVVGQMQEKLANELIAVIKNPFVFQQFINFPRILITNFNRIFTQNSKHVSSIIIYSKYGKLQEFLVQGDDLNPKGKIVSKYNNLEMKTPCDCIPIREIGKICSICNQSNLFYGVDNESNEIYEAIGKPLESALLVLSEKILTPEKNLNKQKYILEKANQITFARNYWNKYYEKVKVLKYDKDRKKMSILVKPKNIEKEINAILKNQKITIPTTIISKNFNNEIEINYNEELNIEKNKIQQKEDVEEEEENEENGKKTENKEKKENKENKENKEKKKNKEKKENKENKEIENVENYYLFVKGTFKEILNCSDYILKDGNEIINFNSELKKKFLSKGKELCQNGKSCLGFGYKIIKNNNIDFNKDYGMANDIKLEKKLIFIGFCGISDTLDEQMIENSLNELKNKGIKTIIVSSEEAETVSGMMKNIPMIKQFKQINSTQCNNKIKNNRDIINNDDEDGLIISEANSQTKCEIVDYCHKQNLECCCIETSSTLMDSLQKADIKIVPATNGSDLAKSHSDIILINHSIGAMLNYG
ncbi:sodium/potassium-transporting atpase subunit alpha [Anaeramoeba flamelloides]|uniref:Sodium/potassium-transporting atpase subunit alpha n=1 Tax=Anaeramoeba flamelloides TaxID=1746091 RepID=A0ABQ8ZEB5_9EUKA|nr:sodium/potassium-transporting atpase subunit alpha [Anaeramoeba flamelloides]